MGGFGICSLRCALQPSSQNTRPGLLTVSQIFRRKELLTVHSKIRLLRKSSSERSNSLPEGDQWT